jgi:hypothetical protein
MEIIKQNLFNHQIWIIPFAGLYSIASSLFPLIICSINGTEFFLSSNHKYAFWSMRIVVIFFQWANILLSMTLYAIYDMKVKFKQAMMGCLDGDMKNLYSSTSSSSLPRISPSSAQNLKSAVLMGQILHSLNMSVIRRATTFLTFIFAGQSI